MNTRGKKRFLVLNKSEAMQHLSHHLMNKESWKQNVNLEFTVQLQTIFFEVTI